MAILLEGGNAIQGASPFTAQQASSILTNAQRLLPKGIKLYPIGSAGHKAQSGDFDTMIDRDDLAKWANLHEMSFRTDADLRKLLKADLDKKNVQTAQSGVSVHFGVPIPGTKQFAQVDVMVVPEAAKVAQFHQHDYSDQNSPYKGVHKQLLLAKLARARGMLWSAWDGLYRRDPNTDKKAEFITRDIDKVAQILLDDPSATGQDLGSVEKIVAKIPEQWHNAVVRDAAADPKWQESLPHKPEIAEGSGSETEWYRGILDQLK